MGSEGESRIESALEARVRLLRDLEQSAAAKTDPSAALLAAIHELLVEAEAELDQRL
jgi:hypothetical protein